MSNSSTHKKSHQPLLRQIPSVIPELLNDYSDSNPSIEDLFNKADLLMYKDRNSQNAELIYR